MPPLEAVRAPVLSIGLLSARVRMVGFLVILTRAA